MQATISLNEKYEKAIVTFIDVLGFKSKVEKYASHQIGNLVHIFKEVAGKPRASQTHNMNTICFSDLIVRVTKPNNLTNEKAFRQMLFSELEDLAEAQWTAMNIGFLIRGGVCYGDIYFFENTVFGPALIDAYKMESKKAKVPMIMVSEELCNSLSEPEKADLIQQDLDGKFFIDYLGFVKNFNESQYAFDLDKHRVITEKQLDQWEGNEGKKEEFRRWWNWYEELHSNQ